MYWNAQTAPAQPYNEHRSLTMQWLLTAILGGMLLGTRGLSHVPQMAIPPLERFFCGLSAQAESRTLWNVFLCAELPMLLLLVGLLLCGLCAVGQPFAVTLLLLRGIAIGIMGADTFQRCGIRGGAMQNLLLLPTVFLSSVLLTYAAKDALTLSSGLLHCLRIDTDDKELPSVRKKLHRNLLILTGLSLVVSLLHTALQWLLHAGILPTP